MKKILSLFIILSALAVTSNAQKLKGTSRDSSKTIAPATQKDWSKVDLNKRPADHFIFQYGLDGCRNQGGTVEHIDEPIRCSKLKRKGDNQNSCIT